jgi:hypothetical protein
MTGLKTEDVEDECFNIAMHAVYALIMKKYGTAIIVCTSSSFHITSSPTPLVHRDEALK